VAETPEYSLRIITEPRVNAPGVPDHVTVTLYPTLHGTVVLIAHSSPTQPAPGVLVEQVCPASFTHDAVSPVGLLILLTVGVVVDRLLHAFQQTRVFNAETAEVAMLTETVAVPDWVLPTLRTNATVMCRLP
jgi:hypothetical protein